MQVDNTDTFLPDDRVAHFRLRRLLGAGGMGRVFEAEDEQLGRRVALKLIRPERVSDPEERSALLAEARAVAALSHPGIVGIHQIGEHDGAPFVVFELIDGVTLRQRLEREGRFGARAAARVVRDIARALEAAHQAGVVHRDLKPENVLLGRDGRLRVVDFGVAMHGPDAVREAGTPAYMAPEQWRREPTSAASDLFALGVLFFELLAGRRPYAELEGAPETLAAAVGSDSPPPALADSLGVPTELAALLGDCLAKSPQDRPSAAALSSQLDGFLGETITGHAGSDSAAPFRGLEAYDEEDAEHFFGRERELGAIDELLRRTPVLSLVGPSGAGKTSLIQAGLIPRLREQRPWVVIRLRPGRRPFPALADALLAQHSSAPRTLPDAATAPAAPISAEALREAPARLGLELRRIADSEHSPVLLIVDPLEELITLTADDACRQAFFAALRAAVDDDPAHSDVRLLLSYRDDFLVRLAPVGLGLIHPLTRPDTQALEEILQAPLHAAGYRFEDAALVAEMSREVASAGAGLPLLQFAARRMWEERDTQDRLLRRESYTRMGGVAGALADHADTLVAALDGSESEALRPLLLRLVTEEMTRKTVPTEELLEGLGAGARPLLERLVDARLLVADRGRVELAHEALIRGWATLRHWCEESHEERVHLADAAQSARLWRRRGAGREGLLRGEALRALRAAVDHRPDWVPPGVRDYLEASEAESRRALRRRRLGVMQLVALLLVIAVASTLAALEMTRRAAEARSAHAEALAESAHSAWVQQDLAVAQSRAAASLRRGDTLLARSVVGDLLRSPLAWRQNEGSIVNGIAFSASGAQLAVATNGGRLLLRRSSDGQGVLVAATKAPLSSVAFGEASAGIFVGAGDGRLRHFGRDRAALDTLALHEGRIYTLALSADGARIASGGADGTVVISQASPLMEERRLQPGEGEIWHLQWHPDGRRLLVGADRGGTLWDLDGNRRIRSIPRAGATMSADGRRLALLENPVTVLDTDTLEALPGPRPPRAGARYLALDSSGERLALSDPTGVRVFRYREGWQEESRISLPEALRVQFSPDRRFLAITDWQRGVHVYDLARLAQRPRIPPAREALHHVLWTRDGEGLVVDGNGRCARRFDRSSPAVRADLPTGCAVQTEGGGDNALAVDPSTRRVAMHRDGRLHIVSLRTGDRLHSGVENVLRPRHLAFAPDAGSIYAATWSESVLGRDIIPAEAGQPLVPAWSRRTGQRRIRDLALSQDGATVVTVGWEGDVASFAARDGAPIAAYRGEDPVRAACAWDAGFLLATREGELLAWSAQDPQPRSVHALGQQVTVLGCDSARHHLAVAGPGAAAALFDPSSGTQRPLPEVSAPVNALAFSPDGSRIAGVGDNGHLHQWRVADQRPLWHGSFLPPPGEALPSSTFRLGHAAGDNTWCAQSWEGELHSSLAAPRPSAPLERIVAMPGACLLLAAGRARLLRAGGHLEDAGAAEALHANGDSAWILEAQESRRVDARGYVLERQILRPAPALLFRRDDSLVVAHAEGSIRWQEPAVVVLRDTPVAAPRVLRAGPANTLVAGFSDGSLGLWAPDGQRLLSENLHGAVVDIALRGDRLLALSRLGDRAEIDLSVYLGDPEVVLETLLRSRGPAFGPGDRNVAD